MTPRDLRHDRTPRKRFAEQPQNDQTRGRAAETPWPVGSVFTCSTSHTARELLGFGEWVELETADTNVTGVRLWRRDA